ncbi:peptidase family M48-domain-containing protein [Amanita rubescens]|nr:peptidase family M48-domain-containing protein [Amanita rubescens]
MLWRSMWPRLRCTNGLAPFSRLRPNLHYTVYRASVRAGWPIQRHLSSTPSRQARYVRFDDYQRPDNATPNNSPWRQYSQYWNRLDKRLKYLTVAVLVSGVYYVAHLEQVPETGRWRFMNTSPESEAKYGDLARAEIRGKMGDKILDDRHPVSRHVRRVVQRILSSNGLGSVKGMDSELKVTDVFSGNIWDPDAVLQSSSATRIGPEKDWEVIVVDDPKIVNAMATPGTVVVFTGILPVCQDEPGLSAVLSHEIGHIVARHAAERISSQVVTINLLLLLSLAGLDMHVSQVVGKLLLELPNSRAQEREADYIGLRLMAKACYDPGAAPQMFERLSQIESKIGRKINLDFIQTHPSTKSRVEYLQQTLPEAYAIRASNAECTDMEEKVQEFRGIRAM